VKPAEEVFGKKGGKSAHKQLLVDMTHDRATRLGVPFYLREQNFEATFPQTYGLLVPFYAALAKDDKETVPDFFDRYLNKSLGESIEEVVDTLRDIRSAWGVACSTVFGQQVTHLVKVIDIALQAQARPIPIITDGQYLGCAISGAGFTIVKANREYRPWARAELMASWPKVGIHKISLAKIAMKVAANQRPKVMACTSMWELHSLMIEAKVKETDRAEIITAAKGLLFEGHKSWQVNLSNLKKAFSLVRSTDELKDSDRLPIHSSTVLSTGRIELVWSCFGGMAPSFKVPGGKNFKLSEDMMYDLPGKDPKKKEKGRIVRISVTDKPLEIAVKDLKTVIESQSIDNPLVMSRVKRSESSHNKAFMGDDGATLLVYLRELVGLEASGNSSKKRKADDSGEGSSKKKARFAY
jgi:hypothetical protein